MQVWAAEASLFANGSPDHPLPSSGDLQDALYGMVGDVIPQQVQGLHVDLFKICPQAQRNLRRTVPLSLHCKRTR